MVAFDYIYYIAEDLTAAYFTTMIYHSVSIEMQGDLFNSLPTTITINVGILSYHLIRGIILAVVEH